MVTSDKVKDMSRQAGLPDEPWSLCRSLRDRGLEASRRSREADGKSEGDSFLAIEQWNEEELESTRPSKRQNNEPPLSSCFATAASKSVWWDPLPSVLPPQVWDGSADKESFNVEVAPAKPFSLDRLLRCESVFSDLGTIKMEAPTDATSKEALAPLPSECVSVPSHGRKGKGASSGSSLLISSHATSKSTVLFIDIQGFSTQCAILSVAEVGIWIAEFYARVGEMSAKHGVCNVEARGDCCVCVCGDLPVALQEPRQEETTDQVTRMLGFASDVDEALSSLNSPCITRTRMGMATGGCRFFSAT